MPQIKLSTLLDLVGVLSDSTDPGSASERFRKYLRENVHQVEDVRDYVTDALAETGEQSNKALQDLINHIGQLLGFEVVYGRYRGTANQIGFDGLWQSPTGWSIVVETKTTDVYTVRTATLLGYINSLVSEGRIKNPAKNLGLYVYGRFDAETNQMENAITVEGRRDQLRVVSVSALLNLLQLEQEYRLGHKTVLDLLLPAPVGVDPLINLIFEVVAQEKEEAEETTEETIEETDTQPVTLPKPQKRGAPPSLTSIGESYTGRTPTALVFEGKRYPINTWKEGALALFEALRLKDQPAFEKAAVTMLGKKRPYMATSKAEMRAPQAIPNTSLYFESNQSANSMVRLCCTLIEKMGYGRSDLEFETEE